MLREKYIPVNPFTRPGKVRSVTRNVVWHYTANPGATAENHYQYFGFTLPAADREILRQKDAGELDAVEAQKRLVFASANVFIDKNETLVIIPLDEESWHASRANPYSVGVELCIEPDGSFHPETVRRAAELGRYLNAKYNLKTSDYMRHYDVTGKICPKPWVDNPAAWEAFKQHVAQKGDGKVPNWTDEQWTQFAKTLNDLYQLSVAGEITHPVFSDYTYAEKAYNRELSLDDALWLVGIMFGRSQGVEL